MIGHVLPGPSGTGTPDGPTLVSSLALSGPMDSPSIPSGPHGAWRSSVARLLWEQEVPGSNPGAPIRLITRYRSPPG